MITITYIQPTERGPITLSCDISSLKSYERSNEIKIFVEMVDSLYLTQWEHEQEKEERRASYNVKAASLTSIQNTTEEQDPIMEIL